MGWIGIFPSLFLTTLQIPQVFKACSEPSPTHFLGSWEVMSHIHLNYMSHIHLASPPLLHYLPICKHGHFVNPMVASSCYQEKRGHFRGAKLPSCLAFWRGHCAVVPWHGHTTARVCGWSHCITGACEGSRVSVWEPAGHQPRQDTELGGICSEAFLVLLFEVWCFLVSF